MSLGPAGLCSKVLELFFFFILTDGLSKVGFSFSIVIRVPPDVFWMAFTCNFGRARSSITLLYQARLTNLDRYSYYKGGFLGIKTGSLHSQMTYSVKWAASCCCTAWSCAWSIATDSCVVQYIFN